MASKAQKRAAGEAKAKREAEERRQSGLEAQRIGRVQDAVRMSADRIEVQQINARHAEILQRAKNPVQPEVTVGDFRAVMDLYETVINRRLRDEISPEDQPPLIRPDYTKR